jgi:tetratricopeptide (TPR) repeat protein
VPLLEQAVALGEAQQPLFVVSFLTAQGRTFSQLGQFARARQCFEAARARAAPAPRFIVTARIAESWLAWAMGKPAPALLDDAMTHIPARSRASLAMDVTLAQAPFMDDKKAPERVRQVRNEARGKQLFGIVLNAEVRLAQIHLRREEVAKAATHARAAMAMSRSFAPDDMYVGEVWLAAYHALRAANDAEAQEVLAHAVTWVRKTAEASVPAEFRDSFLNRNPVNLELLRLASRELVVTR